MLNNDYFIWGAGTYGQRLIEFMKDDISFKAVIDNNPQKQGTLFSSLPVISYDEAKCKLPDVKIIITINIPIRVQEFLISEGFVRNEDFFVIHDFLPRYYWEKDRSLVVKTADFSATTICTMKCEGCQAYIPMSSNSKHASAENICRDVDLLFNHVGTVMNMNFCVGESLLNDELPDAVSWIYNKYKKRYRYLSLQTNGTVMPKDAAMRLYRDANALIVIANYPENVSGTEGLIKKCKDLGVSWFYNSAGGDRENWMDFGDPRLLYKTDSTELRYQFAHCWHPGVAVNNGLLYMCAQQAWSNLLVEEEAPKPGDSFDLRQPKTEAARYELYKVISQQPPEQGYISHCMRCNGVMTQLVKE